MIIQVLTRNWILFTWALGYLVILGVFSFAIKHSYAKDKDDGNPSLQCSNEPTLTVHQIPSPCGYYDREGARVYGNQLWNQFIIDSQLDPKDVIQLTESFLRQNPPKKEFQRISLSMHGCTVQGCFIEDTAKKDNAFIFLAKEGCLFSDQSMALMLMVIDNLHDVLESADYVLRPKVAAEIDATIFQWCTTHDVFVRKLNDNRYIGLINHHQLNRCKLNKFNVMDQIRAIDIGNRVAPTVSIGMSIGDLSALELGLAAEDSLAIALARGGDQAVLKEGDSTRYYGARIHLLRSRQKVNARMAADRFASAIETAERVFIVGHKAPDLDAFGAAIAASVLARNQGKEPQIVVDENDPWIDRLSNRVIPKEAMTDLFITSDEVKKTRNENTVLVVVDTNRPHLVLDPALLDWANRVVVIDHHRRVDEVIDQAEFIYADPHASSASELLIEFFQFSEKAITLESWEATIILSGIALDTKNFTIHTGQATFEAAAYLREQGGDPVMIREMMRDDLSTFTLRAEIMHNIEIYNHTIALGFCSEVIPNASEIAAQAADQMLNIRDVEASFVCCKFAGGVWISARSLGDINVQNILERLNGGGHMMGAGAQLKDVTVEEAKQKLIQVIDDYLNRRE